MFHTHLIRCALALLPPLCPVAKGKHCMFIFVLEVLDEDGPEPYGSGSFFSIGKKAVQSRGPQHKSGPPASSSSSHPPLPPIDLKIQEKFKALKWDLAAMWPPAPATPPPALSPLLALTPSKSPGSLHVSLEFMASWSPMPGLPPEPMAPLNPLPSSVTLSQVEDVLAMSEMVRDLTSHHLPPSLSTSFDSPSSSLMVVDVEDALSTLGPVS
jgi:hypothetical protein